MCAVRNLIRDNRVVYGGGAAEVACSLAISEKAEKISGVEQYAIRAFASALDAIPIALASNSGLAPIETLASVKAQQLADSSSRIGVDCMQLGTADMKLQNVNDPFISKRQQFLLATQLVKMILKIDDVIQPTEIGGRDE